MWDVEVVTFDSCRNAAPRLIRIDVEGYEFGVIACGTDLRRWFALPGSAGNWLHQKFAMLLYRTIPRVCCTIELRGQLLGVNGERGSNAI